MRVSVEHQGPGERVEDLLGRVPVTTLLEPDVVVGGHARQQRELLAPEAGDAAALTAGEADVLGPDELAPGAEEVADAVLGHVFER